MREYMRKLRESCGLSQQDVATKISVSRQYYCYIEKGERQKKMDITLATKLAGVFGVPPERILTEESKLCRP